MADHLVKRKPSAAEQDVLSATAAPITETNSAGDGDRKSFAVGHVDYHGIDTTQVQPGADAAYEAKITVLNEALIDIGMGPFQWKIFATTGFGWFVDNVSKRRLPSLPRTQLTRSPGSSGCKP